VLETAPVGIEIVGCWSLCCEARAVVGCWWGVMQLGTSILVGRVLASTINAFQGRTDWFCAVLPRMSQILGDDHKS